MKAADQHAAEDRLLDLMVLGAIASNIQEERDLHGPDATVPTAWLGLLGRLTERLAREASSYLGDLPDVKSS